MVLPGGGEVASGLCWVLAVFLVFPALIAPLGLHLPRPDGRMFLVLRDEFAAGTLTTFAESALVAFFSPHFLLLSIMFSIRVAIIEELLFRSVLLGALEERTQRPALALTGSSIMFGLAHLANGAQGWSPLSWNWAFMLLATIAGLGYGIVYQRTSSIVFPILLHGLGVAFWRTHFH